MDGFLHIGKTKFFNFVSKYNEDTGYLYDKEFQRDICIKFNMHMYLFISPLDLINCSIQVLPTIIPYGPHGKKSRQKPFPSEPK